MGFGTFIRSNLLPVSLAFASFALIAFVLATTGVGWPVIVLVCGIGVGCALTALVASFLARREFYRDLARMTDEGANPLWFNELMERPDVAEDALAFDALRAMAKAASDEVAGARRYVVDYREYVETWVHEAKSPLAAAHLMVENLRGEGGLDEGARARLDTLDEELDRTEGYIEQALFYARSETLDRDYLIRSYALSDLVASAVKANARELIAAGAAPVLHDLDQRVFTDEKWMAFILGQVVQNSIKYARTEGARIEFSARLLDAGSAEERVVLRVSDNGCGVGAADLPRVFDKGFTGEAGRSGEAGHTGKRSTGIGLYLVKKLCDKMNVNVAATSVPGSSFTVEFSFPANKYSYFEG